jgi:hypothetical protein
MSNNELSNEKSFNSIKRKINNSFNNGYISSNEKDAIIENISKSTLIDTQYLDLFTHYIKGISKESTTASIEDEDIEILSEIYKKISDKNSLLTNNIFILLQKMISSNSNFKSSIEGYEYNNRKYKYRAPLVNNNHSGGSVSITRRFKIDSIKKGNSLEKVTFDATTSIKPGSTPLSAARKLLTSYCEATRTPKSKVNIVYTIREITRDYKKGFHKVYGPYSGKYHMYTNAEKKEAKASGVSFSGKPVVKKQKALASIVQHNKEVYDKKIKKGGMSPFSISPENVVLKSGGGAVKRRYDCWKKDVHTKFCTDERKICLDSYLKSKPKATHKEKESVCGYGDYT